MFHAGDISTIDPQGLAQFISGVGFTGLLSLCLVALWRRWVVTGAELEQLRASMQKQIDDKDAALLRKDTQIENLQAGLTDKAIPTITEAIVTMRQLAPLVEKLAPLVQSTVSLSDPRRPE